MAILGKSPFLNRRYIFLHGWFAIVFLFSGRVCLRFLEVSIHSMVSMGSCRVGPELRVTSADGQIIKQMQFDDEKEG